MAEQSGMDEERQLLKMTLIGENQNKKWLSRLKQELQSRQKRNSAYNSDNQK